MTAVEKIPAYKNLRREPRVLVNEAVIVWVAKAEMLRDSEICVNEPTRLDAALTDISKNGLGFATSEPLNSGDWIWVQAAAQDSKLPDGVKIALSQEDPLIMRPYLVVHCRRVPTNRFAIGAMLDPALI